MASDYDPLASLDLKDFWDGRLYCTPARLKLVTKAMKKEGLEIRIEEQEGKFFGAWFFYGPYEVVLELAIKDRVANQLYAEIIHHEE